MGEEVRRGIDRLTPRQRQVLALLASGMTRGQIAAALGLSEETVHRHLNRLYWEIGLRDHRPMPGSKRHLAIREWERWRAGLVGR